MNADYSKLFNEIEIMCKKNLYALRDIIKDYDVKKEGKISRFRFEKVFNSISVYVVKPIIDQVIIEYTVFVDVVKSVPASFSNLELNLGIVTFSVSSFLFFDSIKI